MKSKECPYCANCPSCFIGRKEKQMNFVVITQNNERHEFSSEKGFYDLLEKFKPKHIYCRKDYFKKFIETFDIGIKEQTNLIFGPKLVYSKMLVNCFVFGDD